MFFYRGGPASPYYVPEETRSYYSADEKLTYYNRHFGWSAPGEVAGVFDEYRYDPLGRRVLMRSRTPSVCGGTPCQGYVERTVWDGDQVVWEARASGKQGVESVFLESYNGVAIGDDPNLYGIVQYAHAQGIDQPVGILKDINPTGLAYVTPHANWKGEWSYGTFSTGALCLTTGATCPTWPGYNRTMDGHYDGTQPPTYTVWWGNTIQGRADNSGLQYLRNRYYDPKTGRFTQIDPIGLAGGMNLYGFASGDPVNFADPMGLCPGVAGTNQNYFGDCPSDQKFIYLMQARLAPLQRTLDRVGEATGVSGLGRGAGRALSGDVLGGGLEFALSLPLVPGERVLISGGKIGSSVAKVLGIARRELGNRIEAIKKAAGLGGAENVIITSTGNVFDKATGELLNNVHDVIPKK